MLSVCVRLCVLCRYTTQCCSYIVLAQLVAKLLQDYILGSDWATHKDNNALATMLVTAMLQCQLRVT